MILPDIIDSHMNNSHMQRYIEFVGIFLRKKNKKLITIVSLKY